MEKDLPILKKKCKDPEEELYENGKIKYRGDFQKDLFYGFGIYYSEKGRKIYEGEWKNGVMDGEGSFFIKERLSYKGEWKKGRKNGKGILFYKNGEKEYDGEWKNGGKNGIGKYYFPSGKLQYNGEWLKDEAEGYGKSYYNTEENTIKYNGNWQDSQYHGKGVLYKKDKSIDYDGNWEEGKKKEIEDNILIEKKKGEFIELSFKTYNTYCLKEFKRDEWNIMSNEMFYNECNILEHFLYFLDSFDEPILTAPNYNLPLEIRIQHLKEMIKQYYKEKNEFDEIKRIDKHSCTITIQDISILGFQLNIWIYIYKNTENSWVSPSIKNTTLKPRKIIFLYQQKEEDYFIMFPKKIENTLNEYIEPKPEEWNKFKSFLTVDPKVIKFYQKIIKSFCFIPPFEKEWNFIPIQSLTEGILTFFHSMKIRPWDIPNLNLKWDDQVDSLREIIKHDYKLSFESKIIEKDEYLRRIYRLDNKIIEENDIKILLGRNGIWYFTFLEKPSDSPFQLYNGYWDIPEYHYFPRGVIFFFKNLEGKYSLISPRKETIPEVISIKESRYNLLKEKFKKETKEENEQEEDELMLMEEDNIYTWKKEVWNLFQYINQFIRKNYRSFEEEKYKDKKYKDLLKSLHNIKNNIDNYNISSREEYYEALLSNNFNSKIRDIFQKFQKSENESIFLFHDKEIISERTNELPKKVIFLYKKNSFITESKDWDPQEFIYICFNTIPEHLKNYIIPCSSKEKQSSKEKSSSSSSSKEKQSSKEKSSSSSSSKEKQSSKDKSSSSSSSKEKQSSYENETASNLIKMCRERGIKLKSYKKDFLIEKLQQYDKKQGHEVKVKDKKNILKEDQVKKKEDKVKKPRKKTTSLDKLRKIINKKRK